MSERIYTVFRRSARNLEQFARARKVVVRRNLTLEEARRLCADYNQPRTPAQVHAGTKLEFTSGSL